MENKIQIFEHEKFGKLRTLVNDDIWFVAADVCRALEIGNTSQAITRLRDDEKMTLTLGDLHSGKRGGAQFMTLINEPGFYRLVFASRKKEAIEMQDWVYHEVLPSIRKTGSYSLVTKPKHIPNPNRVAGQLTPASVYAALMNDGTIKIVKIGQSNNVEDRLSEVSSPSKLTVERYYKTSPMPRKIARLVEKACHNIFSSFRVNGEFFSVDFDTACTVVIAFEKFVVALPSTTDCEKLLKATNSIVGKNAD